MSIVTALLGPAMARGSAPDGRALRTLVPHSVDSLAAQSIDPIAAHSADPLAWAAREVNLQETGHLHAVGEPGTTFVEHGSATGTFDCSIAGRLTIVSANRAIATFTVKPRGGSVTGRGAARFAAQGADGYFGGTISIVSGTGSFAHASGTNIGISGVISRETFALTVHVHGKIRL